jgi:hypothetical protein
MIDWLLGLGPVLTLAGTVFNIGAVVRGDSNTFSLGRLKFRSVWLMTISIVLTAVGGLLSSQNDSVMQAKLMNLSESMVKNVTGGDSYCHLLPQVFGDDLNFYAIQMGPYPVYDVSINIFDEIKHSHLHRKYSRNGVLYTTIQDISSQATVLHRELGTMPARVMRYIGKHSIGNDKEPVRLIADISARNGWVRQQINLRWTGVRWALASRTTIDRHGKEEHVSVLVDDDYPRRHNGTIDWQ